MKSPQPNKSLGQHWLHDEASLQAMVAAADVVAGDVVVEVGPGLGTLTAQLLAAGAQVWAIEFDRELARTLPERLHHPDGLRVIEADILRFDFSRLPAGYKIVANIPYYLTSHLMRLISETANPPSKAALLVQKEVAARAAATPPDMSLLALGLQWYNHVRTDLIVPAELFTPPPKIDSQILCLSRRSALLVPDIDTKQLFGLMRAGFANKRKTLQNALSGHPRLDKTSATALLLTAGIDPQRRAETLDLTEWCAVYEALPKYAINS
jgi:16S rRNA (adenine1518-N6/adenine1519-N6)-dimethyltransferase